MMLGVNVLDSLSLQCVWCVCVCVCVCVHADIFLLHHQVFLIIEYVCICNNFSRVITFNLIRILIMDCSD